MIRFPSRFCFAALTLAGCSSTSPDEGNLPALGLYDYAITWRSIDGTPLPPKIGTFALSFSAADSLAGTWAVADYRSSSATSHRSGGGWILDAATGSPLGSLHIRHVVTATNGGLQCTDAFCVECAVSSPAISCSLTKR